MAPPSSAENRKIKNFLKTKHFGGSPGQDFTFTDFMKSKHDRCGHPFPLSPMHSSISQGETFSQEKTMGLRLLLAIK